MKAFLLILFISIICCNIFCIPINKDVNKYDIQCPSTIENNNSDKINVHLIPHSHDDVGWLKTVDQYYYGMNSDIQQAGVQYIISSTVEALKNNPQRTFVQVESAFFWKWWKDQTDTKRADFKMLVDNGQIEIINGAWSMNDEACPNYQSTIDQFTWGLRILNDTVGPNGAPKIGWQIDPFGHSREQASLFAQFGFDGVFFARLDNQDRETRKRNKTMDFLWQGSANLEDSVIFGNAFPESLYYPPSGFCFDVSCGDDPINDDPESFDYNVVTKVSDFLEKIKEFSTFYPTNNVLIPMGGDFQYQAAEFNYINLDKLIKAFENNSEVNVFYSTPSCYLKSVYEANPELKLKIDDFFPYGSDDHSYWSGYFTSRPNSKRFERQSHNFLQTVKQLFSLNRIVTNGDDDLTDKLRLLREAMGIMQHHDAITGTEKQHVLQDYVRVLHRAVKTAEEPIGHVLGNLLNLEQTIDFKLCLLSNISICDSTNLSNFTLVVYNPLSRNVTSYIRLPVDDDANYTVVGVDGEEVVDIVQSISKFDYVDLDEKPSTKELVFNAKNVPALGFNIYQITKSDKLVNKMEFLDDNNNNMKFGTDILGFQLNNETNLLESVTMNGKTVKVKQELLYYEGSNGDNQGDNKASGAYIFRPLNGTKGVEKFTANVTIEFQTRGELVDEVKQVYNNWVSQIIRVYKDAETNYIEFDWLVGPIDVDEENLIGKEIISRFTIDDFNSDGVFYTDSNGRELIKRQRNKRYDYEYNSTLEPIASNYYPVTSKIVIKDENQQLQVAVLNDRSQGGSSLKDGEVELMVHRRLLKDDAKGVDEALNETEFNQGVVARGQHYLILGPTNSNTSNDKSTTALERELALKKLSPPVILLANNNQQNIQSKQFVALKKALPDNVNILTLEPWKEDSYILRLEHILERNEDINLSQNVTVDLNDLFTLFSIETIRETTLGANKYMDDYLKETKYEWIINGEKINRKIMIEDDPNTLQIALTPMQIRTFIITVSKIE